MCCIAPGGIPGIAIGARCDLAPAELPTDNEIIVATTTTLSALLIP
jgi:hypothetical protein